MENIKGQETDVELVMNVKSRRLEDDSLSELVRRHSAIFHKVRHRFLKGAGQENFLDDLSLNINLIFYNGCIKFDATKKCKFTSFLTNEINWMFLNAWKKHKSRTLNLDPLDTHIKCLEEVPYEEDNVDDKKRNEILSRFQEMINKHEDKRVSEIFKMRYAKGRKLTPWRVIACKIGLTTPGCIYIHDKHVKAMSLILNKESIYAQD